MRLIGEAPAKADLGDGAVGMLGVHEIASALLQPAMAHIVGEGAVLALEQALDVARGQALGFGDVGDGKLRLTQPRLDLRADAGIVGGLHLGRVVFLGPRLGEQGGEHQLGDGGLGGHEVAILGDGEVRGQRPHHRPGRRCRDGSAEHQRGHGGGAAEAAGQPLARHLQQQQLEIVAELHRERRHRIADPDVAVGKFGRAPTGIGEMAPAVIHEADQHMALARGQGREMLRGGTQQGEGRLRRRALDRDLAEMEGGILRQTAGQREAGQRLPPDGLLLAGRKGVDGNRNGSVHGTAGLGRGSRSRQ